MVAGYLSHRVLLKFEGKEFYKNLSGITFADHHLWVASDEENSIERLSSIDSWSFGQHQSFKLKDLIVGFSDEKGEVDIEGLCHSGDYLWLIGSHSSKRKKIKGGETDRLKIIKTEPNRYLLACIPVVEGELKSVHGKHKACYLERNDMGNALISVLQQDEHLAPFLAPMNRSEALPGKDNGFDIEGFLVRKNRLLIGLRGPVLRGIAILLEIEVEATDSGLLKLKPLEQNGKLYKKHFLDLDGLGIRELCADKDDVLILAGPTMALDGSLRLFRLKNPFNLSDNSFSQQETGELTALFDIPYGRGIDRAEGITLYPSQGETHSILVVYDSPNPQRVLEERNIFADVFTLQ